MIWGTGHTERRERCAIRGGDWNNGASAADKIEFVGYIVTARCLRLRKQTTRRIKSAFRSICKKYFAGELSKAEFDRRVASYKGMIQYCEADNLRTRLNEIYLHAKERRP